MALHGDIPQVCISLTCLLCTPSNPSCMRRWIGCCKLPLLASLLHPWGGANCLSWHHCYTLGVVQTASPGIIAIPLDQSTWQSKLYTLAVLSFMRCEAYKNYLLLLWLGFAFTHGLRLMQRLVWLAKHHGRASKRVHSMVGSRRKDAGLAVFITKLFIGCASCVAFNDRTNSSPTAAGQLLVIRTVWLQGQAEVDPPRIPNAFLFGVKQMTSALC